MLAVMAVLMVLVVSPDVKVKDAHLPILGDVFFIILILWGSFFTLNLLLAVLEGNFTKGKEDDKVRRSNHPMRHDHLQFGRRCQHLFRPSIGSIPDQSEREVEMEREGDGASDRMTAKGRNVAEMGSVVATYLLVGSVSA